MLKNILLLTILLIIPISMKSDELLYNQKALDKIYEDIWNCIPNRINDKINMIEEDIFIRGYIGKRLQLDDDFIDDIYDFFDCRKKIFNEYYENLDICKSYFPHTICSRVPVFTIELILKSIHRKATNKPYDMQHDIDSIMTMLNTMDSVDAYYAVADTINGVYIPRDIEEALEILVDYLQHPNDIEKIKSKTEDEFARENYFGLGLTIRNSWLWNASRLHIYIKRISNGIDHPDEQSVILMRFLHRKLNGKPLDKWKLFESTKKQKDKD